MRSPWLSLVVIGTLALTISANATILSLLKPTVLAALPAPDAGRLVEISATDVKTNAYSPIPLPALRLMQEGQQSFTTLGAYVTSSVRVGSGRDAFDAGAEGVTAEYFDLLGAHPRSGRVLSVSDDPAAPVAVLSDRFATRMFGNTDPVGQTLMIESRPTEIVGVLAPGFTGVRLDGGDDVFLSLPYLRAILTGDPKAMPRAQGLIGRLAPAASIESARAEVLAKWEAVRPALLALMPPPQRVAIENQRIEVDSFARGFSSTRDLYGRSLSMTMLLAVALFAVCCVNLSGLMLARALTRQHEFAVRRALGVSAPRLFQQTAIDGVLLATVASAIAIPLAWWASAVLTRMVSLARLLPLGKTTPDWQVMTLATAVSLIAGVAISLLPARHALKLDMDDILRGRGTSHRIPGKTRYLLIAQVALSMVLVVGAGLFVTTLANLYANQLQHLDRQVVWTRLSRNPLQRSTILRQPYFQALQEQLARMPGADAAAMSLSYPAYLNVFDGLPKDIVTTAGGAQIAAVPDYVTPGFFDLFAIDRIRGRDFTWLDNESAPMVAIVNETLARQLSASGDVVGQHVRVTSGPATTEMEIVGIVADANVTNIRERHVAGVYRPMMQDLRRSQFPMAHVRVTGDVGEARRHYIDTINAQGEHFVRGLFTLEGWINNAVVEQQLIAGMASASGALAMMLAAVGLFGLLAYSVSCRVKEIGVRISVGATQREVIRMVMREGFAVVLPGILIGVPLALAAAWTVRSQLYGVRATDPWTVIGAVVVLAVTAAVASWLPARRAAKIQPVDALRQD